MRSYRWPWRIGAPAGNIARLVTLEIFAMVLAGALAGLALGLASARHIEALLYEVDDSGGGVAGRAAGGVPRRPHRSRRDAAGWNSGAAVLPKITNL